ncbi:hypothetical protein [Amycolatopsis taiwanensis]|uniref:hypothetical protein n=1 Tax=Amycolatopsis taiwanensis TaxID=342230 RepID=UPI002556EBC2|nr:hypothetical protein [Amycolatopsis taiwanensis]
MSSSLSSRGNQRHHHARASAPLSGRRGALAEDVTSAWMERPVDKIAVARKLAEELA